MLPVSERLFQTSAKTLVFPSFDFFINKNIFVVEIGFGNEEKKLRWGLSTRVLNFVGRIKKINFGPFSQGGLEKPNPARTIDTLADGS